jgi:hypothetical protein
VRKSYLNRKKVTKVAFTSNLTEAEKRKRKKEREAQKMRKEEASRISIQSFNMLIESGVLFYTEGNK